MFLCTRVLQDFNNKSPVTVLVSFYEVVRNYVTMLSAVFKFKSIMFYFIPERQFYANHNFLFADIVKFIEQRNSGLSLVYLFNLKLFTILYFCSTLYACTIKLA